MHPTKTWQNWWSINNSKNSTQLVIHHSLSEIWAKLITDISLNKHSAKLWLISSPSPRASRSAGGRLDELWGSWGNF